MTPFEQWLDTYTEEHGAPYAQGNELRDAFEAGRASAYQTPEQHDAEQERKAGAMSGDVPTVTHADRWCGKFYTIGPGIPHTREQCGY